METLCAKLYDKYTTFKPQTQHLRSENQNLKENMERLRNEIAEIRHIYQGRGVFGASKVSCGRRTKE
ncbi:hypothetical protein F2Q70_00008608 [Brassica cretica]|uniref:Uncharacterized protein n=1 Tax=Brassica cretica TaxID=69181 RepID=A0A8S9M8Z3_BRACR|nr:hypothetical protein F2Q70_00008608 [Brassica cretica]